MRQEKIFMYLYRIYLGYSNILLISPQNYKYLMVVWSAEHQAALQKPVKILSVYKNVYKYSVLLILQSPKTCIIWLSKGCFPLQLPFPSS